MKFLITGGAGFIGINFALSLLKDGHEVLILDNLSRPLVHHNLQLISKVNSPKIHFEYGDIRNSNEKLAKLVEQVDFIFHLAGQVAVTTSYEAPFDDFEANALGTLNLLECVRKSKKQPGLIFSSTNKVYGDFQLDGLKENEMRYHSEEKEIAISENQKLNFCTPYGCSKGAADQYVIDYSKHYGLKTVVFRQSCIYGKRQFGVEDQGWVAWFVISSVLRNKITLFGNGKQVRDVLHVDDLYDAFLRACQKIDGVSGTAFNIGGGVRFNISLLELISMLNDFNGYKIQREFSDWRPGDQKVYISDTTLAEKHLGWTPKIEPIIGIKELLLWARENKEIF